MLDKVLANAAEQIAVSPDQSQYTIQNQDVLPGNTAEQQSIIQPGVTTAAINNQLSDNQDWKEYLSNPFRRSDRKTMPFWAIEDMMTDPVYYATANKYGNELRQQGEIMYGAYRKADSWLGRLSDAYNVARYNLRASAARTDLSKALQSGDEEAIAKAQEIYDQEQRNIRTQGLKYDSDFWNSMMDITASMARNPEVFAIGIGAGILTGGAATPAAVTALQLGAAASEAAVVFADTYRVETGGVLQQLDVENPELSEQEKYKIASQAGLINATIESVPMLIGAGLTARSAATLREATKQVVLKSKLPTKLATSAVFLKALGDELQKKTVGGVFLNRLADGALEGVQEIIQDAVQKAAIRAVNEQDRSIAGLTLEDLNEFMSAENPLDPKYADKIDTFVNVGLGSFLLGAPFAVVDAASTRRPQNVREKLQGVQTNLSFLNGLRRWAQGSEVAKSSPETITKKLQNEIKLGTIDGKIYLDKKQVLKLMESDPDVAKALHNLDIEAALQESEENGGVVGVDFLKYEEQVIRGADDTLFQKIRDITSASPTNLSQAAFIEQLSTDQAAVEEIKRAREQPDSVYNQTYNQLIAMPGWDEKSAEAYASMMQLATNRIGAFRLVSSTGEQVFQNVEIRQGYSGEQPATIPPTEQPTTTQPVLTPRETKYTSTTGDTLTVETLDKYGNPSEDGEVTRITVVPDTEDEDIKRIGTHSIYIQKAEDGSYTMWYARPNAGTEQTYFNDGNGWMTPQEADLQYRSAGQSGYVDVSAHQKLTPEQVKEGLAAVSIQDNTLGTETAAEGEATTEPETTTEEAGWFRMEGDKLVIGITPNANPTTLAHEIFHMLSVSMQQAFNSGEMTEYWKKQVNNLAKMVGAEFQTDPADPTIQRLFLTDKQEEKAANMFLQYIKEGKIQNREVAPLFAYMQQAFARICRALGLTGKLSKESMELFDSLFRAQNDIEEEQKLAGLIAFEKPEGADQELYDFYVGTMLSSRAKAAQNLVKKWYAIEKFKQGEKYKAKRRDVFAAIYKQAQESMVYDILRTIEDFGGDPAAALGTLAERYPDANLTLDFLENLKATTPTLEQEVTRLTEEKMEEYVRDEFKITDEELALRVSRNRDKVKALIAEGVLRSGGGMAEFEAAYKKANDAAEKQMSKTSIKRLLDKDYWNTLEARIVERYAYALANKDTDGMMEERYNQAVVNLIKIRAVGYESRVQKLIAFATKLRTNQKKDEYTAEAWDLLQSIIEKFGFKVTATRRSAAPLAEKLRAWIENQERTTFTTVGPLMNFLPMLQKGFDGTIMGMEVKTFDQLDAVLDTIDSIANKEYFLIGENEKIFLGGMSDATGEHFKNKGMKPFDGDLKSNFFHKISRWRNPEPILKAIFPESVMLKIWYPLINAKALANNKEKQWIERYRKVRGKISLSSEKHTYSNGVQLSNAEVADLFLAMGTQHAFENFCMKFGISATQAETVVSEALTATPELENFVKEVWAIYAESTDLLNDEYQKRNNKIFVKKEPRAFTINGIQFEGGYVPETKDISNTAMPWEPQAPSQEMGDIKNEKEIIKQADGEVKSIVDNMERTFMLFARQAYLPLAFNNAAKFMNNTNVRGIIGTKASAFIDDWMQTGFKSVPADTTGVARPIMSATTMAALGGRFMQGLVQLSGIIPAMIHVGASNFLGAAAKNLANPKAFIKAIETARGKSDYMKSRYEDPVSTLFGTSIGEQVSLEGGKGKWAIKGAQKLLMAYITYFDAIVSNMTWDAAYAKALDSGLTEEEATLEADSAVRITQTDSMQATRATALNSPLARALTPFSSYIMGMQSQAFALWTGNDKVKAVEFALGYIVISTFIESLAKEAGEGGDDDDKEYIERALHRWYNEIIGTIGSTAVPFANMGGVVGKKIAAGIERGVTGENEVFEKYGLSVPMIQYLDRIPTSAYNLAAGISSGDDEYFIKSMTSASGLVSRGFEKQLKKMLED